MTALMVVSEDIIVGAVSPLHASADGRLPATVPLREAELHQLWLEQRFPAGSLTSVGGMPVRVLYRGRPGGGGGPDFRDARISLGGGAPRLGDVELHVTAADFRRHGHLSDPAYRRVVLHVVFDAGSETDTPLPGGGRAPVLALRPWVERRSAEIQAWLSQSVAWREPCYTAVSRLGADSVRAVLADGGARRLRRKAAALAEEVAGDGAEQALFRAICGAFGLSRNVEPFRLLADQLPLAGLLREVVALPDAGAEVNLRERLRSVAGFGAKAGAFVSLPWRLDGVRPNAHPAKRIDALATVLTRHRARGLLEAMRGAAAAGAPALVRAIETPGIGRDRAVEVAVNAVLPFLAATGAEEQALSLAARLPPAAAYGSLATLTDALADDRSKRMGRPRVMAGALAQQGALALHTDWCRRGGCGVCPLS